MVVLEGGSFEEGDELLAPEPAKQVMPAQLDAQGVGNLAEHLDPGEVTVGVIDVFASAISAAAWTRSRVCRTRHHHRRREAGLRLPCCRGAALRGIVRTHWI